VPRRDWSQLRTVGSRPIMDSVTTSLKRTSGEQRGRPFQPGHSGNPRGRPKGVPNKVTTEVKAVATELVDDPVYRARLRRALQTRTVAPAIEVMLWHYAYGKPKDAVDLTLTGDAEIIARLSAARA
jgi:hypothetical protein